MNLVNLAAEIKTFFMSTKLENTTQRFREKPANSHVFEVKFRDNLDEASLTTVIVV